MNDGHRSLIRALSGAAAALVAACSFAAQTGTTETVANPAKSAPILRGSNGAAAKWASVVAAAGKADVILLGEQHTDAIAHQVQLALLKDILAAQPRTALSLEFLERNEQPLIDRYQAGTLSQPDFIRETSSTDVAGKGSWVRFYQPLIDAATAAKAPVVGANPPRRLAKLARDKGFDALKALPPEEQANYTLPVTVPTRRERERFLEQMTNAAMMGHGGGSSKVTEADAAPFLRSQELWNATMAASILKARDAGAPKVVHVVGAFHIDEFGGIVRELRARSPKLKILTVLLEPDVASPVRGRANYVVRTTPPASDDGASTATVAARPDDAAQASDLRSAVLPRYDLTVDLDSAKHTIAGRARIQLAATTDVVSLRLAPGASIKDVKVLGGKVKAVETHRVAKDKKRSGADYTVKLAPLVSRPELLVTWEGTLYQDPKAGEAPGEIHNREMRASIGQEGVYLTGDWYPQLAGEQLAEYELSFNRPANLELVASGQRDHTLSTKTGREVWRSAYPVDDMVIVGGPHQVHHASAKGVEIALHLKPIQREQAAPLIEAIKTYLNRYEPLLGPLPTSQYRVVDNFFSSGFAFPGFTLLSSAVIDMGDTSRSGHGYIDHEFVHTWFGAGIPVDKQSGDWCEGLTSYCTNYYGYILDGDTKGARKYRRDAAHSFSKLTAEQDVPLALFGRKPDVSRTIGYNKSAIVFHMLEQEIGRDAFWDALRHLNYRRTGRATSWADLRRAFEDASGQDLGWFFKQWVDSPGAFDATIKDATWSAKTKDLRLTLDKPSPFRVTLPVDIRTGESSTTVSRRIDAGATQVIVSGVDKKPDAVAIDSDYNVFRRVRPEELVPTLDITRRAPKLLAVVDETETRSLGAFLDIFRDNPGADRFRQPTNASRVDFRQTTDTANSARAWSDSAVVIVGSAARSSAGRSILGKVESPVKILPKGFSVAGKEYTGPEYALLSTARHPSLPGKGVTVILANSPESLPKATNLPFYPNSIVVFANGKPVHREDLETTGGVAVKTVD